MDHHAPYANTSNPGSLKINSGLFIGLTLFLLTLNIVVFYLPPFKKYLESKDFLELRERKEQMLSIVRDKCDSEFIHLFAEKSSKAMVTEPNDKPHQKQ